MLNIGMLGLGNVGLALVQGLLMRENSWDRILAYDRNAFKIETAILLGNDVSISSNEIDLIEKSDIIMVCLRTNQINELIVNCINRCNKKKAYVFFQAGLSYNDIAKIILPGIEYHRVVSNINIAACKGYSFILKTDQQKHYYEIVKLLRLLGTVDEISNERDLDNYSIVSGCLPALFAEFVREVSIYANNMGMTKAMSLDLSKHIIETTISRMDFNNLTPNEIIEKVATPGGLTENAIQNLRFKKILTGSIELFFDSIDINHKRNLAKFIRKTILTLLL